MKQASTTQRQPRKAPIAWEVVLAAIVESETLPVAAPLWQRLQIKPSETWTQRATKEAAADALTRSEDWLEYEHPLRKNARDRLNAVRRRLECELWP